MSNRSSGEGTIVQRSDGRWQASLMVGGKRRTVYGKTKAEVHRKLTELRRQAGGGSLPDPGRRTVADLLDEWIAASEPTWKPRRTADARRYAEVHITPAIGTVRLAKLTPAAVQRFYNGLTKTTPPSTAWAVHRALHRACRLGVMWGWLPANPCANVLAPHYKPERKEPWTEEQLRRFLDGAKEHRQYPLWLFLIASGCRLGEAVALRWPDVDLKGSVVCICRAAQRIGGEWVETAPKTRAGTRTVALPAEATAALRRWRARQAEVRLKAGAAYQDNGLVFANDEGGYLSFTTVEWALARTCERLGLPRTTPHGLRHLHASLLLHEGLPLPQVSRRLGHASTQVTATIYAHAIGSGDAQAAAAIERALGG